MRDWSDRVSQHSLSWVVSLLLHAAVLVLLYWWGAHPTLYGGGGAVEVRLVSGIPGGGMASKRSRTGRSLSRERGGSGSEETSEPRGKEGPPPSRAQSKKGIDGPPTPLRSAAGAEISSPKRAPNKVRKPVEQHQRVVTAPSLLAPAVPRGMSPPSERLESAGGGKSRSGLSSEERGHAGGSRAVDERGTGRGSTREREESPGERSGRAGGIGPGVIPGAEAGVGESRGVGVAAARHGSGVGAGLALGRGERSGWGGTAWFHLLRQRIERAKRYPAQARRGGMEGTAEVQFRIARDGSVQGVTIVKSSGFAVLDRASVETIKRAAPFPVISGAIRIPISYRLRDTR